ncbi:MAG: cysteine hydrolase [Chitinophagaceae bacterium]|nr:cysteine hydrolase [Chitinophagaceae bacterium]
MKGFLFAVVLAGAIGSLQAQPQSKTALLIVDMQNDFVRKGAPMEVSDARNTINANQQLINIFREKNLPVIYTKFLATPQPSLIYQWSPKLAAPVNACKKGFKRSYEDAKGELECAEIIDELKPGQSDIIIEKYGYGAFHGTQLDSILKSLNITSLVVTGTVTQICVEETAREAFHYGYKTTVVSDAVSSFAPDLHNAMLKNFAMKFGWVKTAREVAGAL